MWKSDKSRKFWVVYNIFILIIKNHKKYKWIDRSLWPWSFFLGGHNIGTCDYERQFPNMSVMWKTKRQAPPLVHKNFVFMSNHSWKRLQINYSILYQNFLTTYTIFKVLSTTYICNRVMSENLLVSIR